MRRPQHYEFANLFEDMWIVTSFLTDILKALEKFLNSKIR